MYCIFIVFMTIFHTHRTKYDAKKHVTKPFHLVAQFSHEL